MVVNYHNDRTSGEEVADDIAAIGRRAIALQTYVSDAAAMETMFVRMIEHFGTMLFVDGGMPLHPEFASSG